MDIRLLPLRRIVGVRLCKKESPMGKHNNKQSNKKQWSQQWNHVLRSAGVRGVFELKEGGYLIRAQAKDPRTGKKREVRKVLRDATLGQAVCILEEEKRRVRDGVGVPKKIRFNDFATSLLERKIECNELSTEKTRDTWIHILGHLVSGTESKDGSVSAPGFGELYVDEILPTDVDSWKRGVCKLIAKGDYSPHTANGWLRTLKVIDKAITREFRLGQMFTFGLSGFDTSNCETYTEEQPNALPPEWVGAFLDATRKLHPHHYAMTFLGFVTGLRPSSLRPLRRTGPHADVLWDQNRLLVRQSQTGGEVVRKVTKQNTRYGISLPDSAMNVLGWHVDTQLVRAEQQSSVLLFPSITGGFRASSVLNKPFRQIGEAIGLPFKFTQRGMRRTFQDLSRAASVGDLVTRSISGHLTEDMQHHYSTVQREEQRDSIAKVIDLFADRDSSAQRQRVPTGVFAKSKEYVQ
jgi:integrase